MTCNLESASTYYSGAHKSPDRRTMSTRAVVGYINIYNIAGLFILSASIMPFARLFGVGYDMDFVLLHYIYGCFYYIYTYSCFLSYSSSRLTVHNAVPNRFLNYFLIGRWTLIHKLHMVETDHTHTFPHMPLNHCIFGWLMR